MTSSLAPGAAAVGGAARATRRARAELLAEVGAVVEGGSWVGGGYRSPAAWLSHLTGESFGQCKLTIHLADRLRRMPEVASAFAAGDLAESALRLLAAAWHESIASEFERDEEMLVRWATELGHEEFTVVLDTWRMHADPDREERTAQERFDSRRLHVSKLMDGMGAVDGLLDPEGRLTVSEALRVLSTSARDGRTPAQRRADALVMLARFYLDRRESPPGERRNRPKVVGVTHLDEHGCTGGTIQTDSGRAVVPTDTIRRMACDAGIHRLFTGAPGTKLDYGRETRTVSEPLFEVLSLRDHGCRWDGCTVPPGLTEAHHALHWLDLGETEPDNLVLLCWFHHHMLHEQHWSIEPLGAGHFLLHDPHGGTHPMRPPMVGLALPAA